MAPTDASPLQATRFLPGLRGLRILDRQSLAAAAIATALLLFLHYQAQITHYPFDSAVYWAMANPEASAETPIRGYLFPLILGLFNSMGSAVGIGPVDAYRILSSIVYAAVLTLLVPATCHRLTAGKLSVSRRLSPFILVALVFPGLLLYPLSDLPALAFMWLAVHSMLGSRVEVSNPRRGAALAVLAGIAAGAAYNTRTIYLFPGLLLALIVLLQFKGQRRRILYLALGAAAVCLPQILINWESYGVASPNPTTGYDRTQWAAHKGSLFVEQALSGIVVQRYETTIARGALSGSVHYLDPGGSALLNRMCKEEGPIQSITGYLGAVSRHPLEFMGIYARHFINGLDVRDGRAYVTQSSSTRSLASFCCITLWMVLILAIRSGAANRAQPDRFVLPWDWMWPAIFILPTLAIVPGAMETRFMLPLLLYGMGLASTAWSGAWIASELRSRPQLYLPLALMVYAVFFAVTTNTMANISLAAFPAHLLSCLGN